MEIYMEKHRINPFRYERKYLLEKINLNKFLTDLFANNYREIYNNRIINNVYFDTYNYDLLNTYILSQHKTEFENQQQKYTKKYFDIINNEHTLITLNTTDNKTLKFSLPKLNYIKWIIESNFLDITKIN